MQFFMDLTEFVNDNMDDDITTGSRTQTAAPEVKSPPRRKTPPLSSASSHNDNPSSISEQASHATRPQPDRMIDDPTYRKTAASLIQNINKTYAEWSKRKREFQLAITKSQTNALSAGSVVERKLVETMEKGDAEYSKLKVIDEKYVLNEVINQHEQLEAAKSMQEMVKLAKAGQKIKLF